MKETIAVLAGTPVDTEMGVARLRGAGLAGRAYPVSPDPVAQTAFQISPPSLRTAAVSALLDQAVAQGCTRALIYCNSLSGAVDFRPLAAEKSLPIVTPLDVYRALAGHYGCLGVVAANAQGLAGIERAMLEVSPSLRIFGGCCLDAVLAVEAGEPPEALVERLGLGDLTAWMARCGAEAMVLGCTHFPYFRAALEARAALPLIDPDEQMLELLGR